MVGYIVKILMLEINDGEESVLEKILEIIEEHPEFEQYRVKHNPILSFPGLQVCIKERKVLKNVKEVYLTFKEFEILHLLAANPRQVFSKEQIYDIVWNEPYSGDYNIVMTHIHHIREKIEDDPAHPIYIQTVWGVGYRFNSKIS